MSYAIDKQAAEHVTGNDEKVIQPEILRSHAKRIDEYERTGGQKRKDGTQAGAGQKGVTNLGYDIPLKLCYISFVEGRISYKK